jgi:glycosyltransferase involved in cell wall biosynthesis
VVGDGREEEALRESARELGIFERVYFAGYQGNCTGWMKLMDCMVQPSLTEGTPNSVLEAICLEIPIVATAVGGVPALIRNEENGILVPAGDSMALAEAMRRIFVQPELRDALLAGNANPGGDYAPERQRALLLNLYESLSLSLPNS